MDKNLVALVGFVLMFALLMLRVPIGIAMGIAGVLGFGLLSGFAPALNLLANVPLSVLTDYNLSVTVSFYAALVAFIAHRHPQAFPAGRRHSWGERFRALKNLWPTLALFALVLGSMYLGWVTVTEAAGIGAVGALAIGLLRGQLDRRAIKRALIDSLRVSSAIMLIVVGAYLFGYFLTVTQFTQKAVDLLVNLPIGAYGVLALVMLGYLVLGAVMDELAMILLTVPIVYPVMMTLGFDPVWFGVIIVMAVTFGMICPPVGMNVFVINSIARDISLTRIYKGTMPFIAVDVVRLVLLCAFPVLSLWLPGKLG
ncbi:MAG: TRAP transporter large permease subunit [Burkholderiales bacterium]|nr:TRAP transporter large permease subunit [Burkholderiales bacterium]